MKIPLSKILCKGPLPAIVHDESFKKLIASIREKGILTPIDVIKLENGFYACVSGTLRVQACRAINSDMMIEANIVELQFRS